MRGILCSARSIRHREWVPIWCHNATVLLLSVMNTWATLFTLLGIFSKINQVVSRSHHPLCFNTKRNTPVTPGGNPIFTSLSIYCFPGTLCKHDSTARLNNLPPVVSPPEFYPEHHSVSKHAPHSTLDDSVTLWWLQIWGRGWGWCEACKASPGREVKAVQKLDQVIAH